MERDCAERNGSHATSNSNTSGKGGRPGSHYQNQTEQPTNNQTMIGAYAVARSIAAHAARTRGYPASASVQAHHRQPAAAAAAGSSTQRRPAHRYSQHQHPPHQHHSQPSSFVRASSSTAASHGHHDAAAAHNPQHRPPHHHQQQQQQRQRTHAPQPQSHRSAHYHPSATARSHDGRVGRRTGHPGQFRSYPRNWAPAKQTTDRDRAHRPAGPEYSLVCCNVLCGAYIERSYFPGKPGWLLDDAYRRQTILSQLIGGHILSGSSLIALQEVDQFESFWRPKLSSAGYGCLFKARTATQAVRADGSAIAWKRSEFELIDQLPIEYAIYPTNDRKDNVGIGVLLRSRSQSTKHVALINTHILFNPKRGDLKLGQFQILFNSIDAWLNRVSRRAMQAGAASPPEIQILICGDFNALPGSTLLQFALEGELDLTTEQAYRCMQQPHRRELDRKLMDGSQLHRHERRISEEANRNQQTSEASSSSQAQSQDSSVSSSSIATGCVQPRKRRRAASAGADHAEDDAAIDQSDASDDDHASDDSASATDDGADSSMADLSAEYDRAISSIATFAPDTNTHMQPSTSRVSHSRNNSAGVAFPSINSRALPPDAITAFFPFNEHDTPTRCTHQLKLHAAYVDSHALRARGGSSSPAAVGSLFDPLTGLPVRYRPSAHHHRQSAQVDHILFSARPYKYQPDMWRTEEADTPIAAMQNKLNQSADERRLLSEIIDLTRDDDVDDAAGGAPVFASPPPPSHSPMRVTSLLEFPPLSAFQTRDETKFIQVKQQVTDTTIDTAAGQQAQATYVTQQLTVQVRDKALPVPDAPSDHFPIGIKFYL